MIDQIEKPKIERVEVGENNRYGKFVVNPLERGFGQTLGNSLRRVLLNSLPGVAATNIRIEGVQHEFSTVPGMKEDVAELILNIKLLSAKLFTEQPKTVSIDAHGPRNSPRLSPSMRTVPARSPRATSRRMTRLKSSTLNCTSRRFPRAGTCSVRSPLRREEAMSPQSGTSSSHRSATRLSACPSA